MLLRCWRKLKCHVHLPWSSPVADFVRNLSGSSVVCWRADTGFVTGSHQGCEEHAQIGMIATAGGYCTYIHVCRKNKQLVALLGFTELARRTFVLLLRVSVLHYYILYLFLLNNTISSLGFNWANIFVLLSCEYVLRCVGGYCIRQQEVTQRRF